MQTRHLGPLTVSALGLGCMGMSEFYGPADEAEGIATIHRALDLGVDAPRHGRRLRSAHQRDPGRQGDQGPARRRRRRHQVRHRPRSQRPAPARHQRQARLRAGVLRGQPEAPRHRHHRPLLPAPHRSLDADRRDRRRDVEAGRGRQGAIPRFVGSLAGDARARHGGASHRRAADRVLAVLPRARDARSCRPAGGSASASSATARSAAACSAAPSARPTTSRPTTGACSRRATRATTWRTTCALVEQVEALRQSQGLHVGTARPRLGPRPGRGHRADPRHEADHVPRAEPRRAGHRADARRPGRARCRDAGGLAAAGDRYQPAMMGYLNG